MDWKNETERMVGHCNSFKTACTGDCNNGGCVVYDNRTYDGPLRRYLERNYGISGNVGILSGAICPVGLALGMRLEQFGEEHPSGYQPQIISAAQNLQMKSFGVVNSKVIKQSVDYVKTLIEETLPKKETFIFKSNLTILVPGIEKVPNSRINNSVKIHFGGRM
jgi:hypothetical protein